MISLKLNFVHFFDFVHRERIYFLALLFCLTATLLMSQLSSDVSRVDHPSAELELLEERTQKWNDNIKSPEAFLAQLDNQPLPVMAWIGTMTIFLLIFLSGCMIGFLSLFFSSVRKYFLERLPFHPDIELSRTHLFRVSVLAFVAVLFSIFVTGVMMDLGMMNENALGIAQTLLLDGLVCFAIFAVLRSSGIRWGQFMGKADAHWREILRGVAEYAAFFPWFLISLLILLGISALFHYEPPQHPLIEVFLEEQNRSPWVFYGAIALAAVIAPILEEIFFRGFCYRVLKGFCGVNPALVFSSVFFAALHGSWFTFIPIFVLGLGLARLYEKRGNLIACWTFHVLHNILFTVYFFSAKAMLETFHG